MFKQLDNLSPRITLFYKGSECHSSSISGIITILTYIAIILLGVIFSLDFLFKRNPTSYFYNSFFYDVGIFPFDNTGIFHFIEAGDVRSMRYHNKALNVIGLYENTNTISENTNSVSYDHWIYEPCNNQHIGHLKDYLNDSESSFYKSLCINKFYNKTTKEIITINDDNFEYPMIAHGSSNPNSRPYGIFILRCQNHSELNQSECDDEYISDQKALEIDTINMYFIDHYIDVSNYHYPITNFYHKLSNKIVLSSYTINHLNYNPLKLNTHTGIIMTSNSEIKTFNFDVNEKLTTKDENTGIYGSFYFWMQNQMQIYDRSYQKMQDVCASIGGISKLLTIVGYFLNYIFAKITLITDLANDISKKNDKRVKKIAVPDFKTTNKSNSSNILCTELLFQVSKQKTNSNIKRETNILYNNMIDDNVSKSNLKDYSTIQNNISLQKITVKKILYHHICCIKSNIIEKIENIRKRILSEEQLFSFYYLLGSLNNNIINTNQNFKIDLKKSKNWIPNQNIYELGKNLN